MMVPVTDFVDSKFALVPLVVEFFNSIDPKQTSIAALLIVSLPSMLSTHCGEELRLEHV